ncbi:MAG: hypothetical protein K5696_12600 [Lachnospiraceae bacterium]|nr:hypothetical protein [Lachnospiraceae bacterium]
MEMTTVEVLNRGMECLVNNMGIVEAEHFITIVIREKFDYTKWQREYFDQKSPDQIHREAVEYAKNHPYQGKAKVIL